ncbi:MAG: hypothetical protein C4517_15635 [Stygiobacter sp.]|nr:MAG: hypothetical protein C4517_15635 [Stygiobacter sp.]
MFYFFFFIHFQFSVDLYLNNKTIIIITVPLETICVLVVSKTTKVPWHRKNFSSVFENFAVFKLSVRIFKIV